VSGGRKVSGAKVAGGLALAAAAGAVAAYRRADAGWTRTADPADPSDRLLPVGEARTVTTDDGADLALTLAGPADGPLVVLAHGFTNAREVWAMVAHRLIRAGCRVALYDHRGHGSSTSGREGHTIARLGDDLDAVLRSLDAHDAVLVGHSMGGMTIQSFAARHPETVRNRVSALVLVATAAHGISKGSTRGDRIAAKAAGHAFGDRFLGSPVGHAFFRGVFGLAVRRADLLLAQDLFLATPGAAREAFVDAMLSMDLRQANAAIDVPTTVVVGERDTLLPPRLGEAVATSIPGARLVRLPDVGHMLPLEAPERVADLVLEATSIGRTERSLA
jgi:pimeloyl-ACP methyl ester carboxylesterase